MKNIITTILVGLIVQVCAAQYLDYGLRASLGYSNLGNTGGGFTMNGGLTAKIDLKDKFGIGADVLFGFKTGSKSETDNFSNQKTETSHFAGAIDIPVYVYVPFSEHLILEAGLNFGSALGDPSGTQKSGGNSNDLENLTFDPTMGYIFGFKVETSELASFGIRYISTGGGGSIGETSSVQATFGYLINW